jgi:hypothetical protein
MIPSWVWAVVVYKLDLEVRLPEWTFAKCTLPVCGLEGTCFPFILGVAEILSIALLSSISCQRNLKQLHPPRRQTNPYVLIYVDISANTKWSFNFMINSTQPFALRTDGDRDEIIRVGLGNLIESSRLKYILLIQHTHVPMGIMP